MLPGCFIILVIGDTILFAFNCNLHFSTLILAKKSCIHCVAVTYNFLVNRLVGTIILFVKNCRWRGKVKRAKILNMKQKKLNLVHKIKLFSWLFFLLHFCSPLPTPSLQFAPLPSFCALLLNLSSTSLTPPPLYL